MLRYFFTRKALPTVETPESTNFELLSTTEFKDKTIPFTHIYATSESYLKLIKHSLGKDHHKSIIDVSKEQSVLIEQQEKFPINISHFQIDSAKELHGLLGNKTHINIAVVNGIGLSFSDNLVGLGIIQRLAKLLQPCTISVHLMQSLNTRFTTIYTDKVSTENLDVKIHNNYSPVENFFKLDGYIDLTGKMSFKEYSEMSLAKFYATAFSLENLIPTNNIQPRIHTDDNRTEYFKKLLNSDFTEKRPTVMFHPRKEDLGHTHNIETARQLIDDIINKGFHVISNFSHPEQSQHYKDCSGITQSLNDLIHLIQACDAVITIGSLTCHLSAALGKPTILLPTDKSDIRNAAYMPEVLQWLPKSNNKEDYNSPSNIWKNVNTKQVASAISPFISQFDEHEDSIIRKSAPPKIGIVILANQKDKTLTESIDQLISVQEVDPMWIYIAEPKNSLVCNTRTINESIEKAMNDQCEYIWVIDNNIKPEPDYLNNAIKRFSANNKIGIVSGAIHDSNDFENIVKAGGDKFFPKSTYKSGSTSSYKLSKASRKLWVDFESTIIKTSMLSQIGILDENLDTEYKEVDLCLRAVLHNWNIYYEPMCKSSKDSPAESDIDFNFNSDIQAFFKKWSTIVHCKNINKLDLEIRKHIKKHILNNMAQTNNLRL